MSTNIKTRVNLPKQVLRTNHIIKIYLTSYFVKLPTQYYPLISNNDVVLVKCKYICNKSVLYVCVKSKIVFDKFRIWGNCISENLYLDKNKSELIGEGKN